MTTQLKVGDKVLVPWGLEESRPGTVVEVWGDPPAHVRVQIHVQAGESDDPVILLLAPSALLAA